MLIDQIGNCGEAIFAAIPNVRCGGRELSRARGVSSAFLCIPAILLFFALTADARAADEQSVGIVTRVENDAQVVSGGVNTTASTGTVLHMKDELRTGANGRLQVTFRDKTVLTLGENATVVIDRYVFDPDAGIGEAALNSTRGAFRFATGRISAMQQKEITVTTPSAALAVRGTDFWGGPIHQQYGVLLVSNSNLLVKNDLGSKTLTKSGWGTYIPQGGPPGPPSKWPKDVVAFALGSTAIGLGATNPGGQPGGEQHGENEPGGQQGGPVGHPAMPYIIGAGVVGGAVGIGVIVSNNDNGNKNKNTGNNGNGGGGGGGGPNPPGTNQ